MHLLLYRGGIDKYCVVIFNSSVVKFYPISRKGLRTGTILVPSNSKFNIYIEINICVTIQDL